MTIDTIEYLGTDKPINNSKPLVSICITTYQHAEYIEQCIQGALAQRCDHPYEILLGDDESDDGTREICQLYAEKHPDKIRLFLHSRKDNYSIAGGATGKNNFLYNIKQARGKYLVFCDGDDYWTSTDKLTMQHEALELHKDSLVCFHKVSTIDDSTGEHGFAGDFGSQSKLIPAQEVIRRLGGAMPMNSIMISARLKNQILHYGYEVPGMHFFIQALASSTSSLGAVYLAEPMACYRRNSNSSVTGRLHQTKQGKLEVTQRNIAMLDIIVNLADDSLTASIKKAKYKLIRKAVSSGLISLRDVPLLCKQANISLLRLGIFSAVIKSLAR